MSAVIQISRENVLKVLNWEDTVAAVRAALLSVTEKRAIQSRRTRTCLPGSEDSLISMPGYLSDEEYHALSCKLLTYFPDNSKFNLPTISASIILLNDVNGTLEAVMDGTEITLWRTAAASVIATKYLRSNKKNNILAILGAGAQAKIHAIAFQELLKFNEIHIWNIYYEDAKKLCEELNNQCKGGRYLPFEAAQECVKEADVLVTATYSTVPLIKYEWLRKGVHINAIGFNTNIMELDEETYKSSVVFVDHLAGVEHELEHLTDMGITFKGEVGALINGSITIPNSHETTIFQSLGIAVEDSAMARLVYRKYMEFKEHSNASEKN